MNDPSAWKKTLLLKGDKKVGLRPIQSSDTEMLWKMYSTMSERSLCHLVPPFTRERIEKWTRLIDYSKVLTIVAVLKERDGRHIIGSASLSFNERKIMTHKAELSIAVHDNYQNMGLGTAMLEHVISIADMKGLKKIWLLVDIENEVAVHLYKKVGFEIEAKLFKERYCDVKFGDCYRMAIFL
jgi:putative acetyltransferase